LSMSVSMSTWCCKCDEVGVTPHTAHLKLDQFFFFRVISLQSRCVRVSPCLLATSYLKTTLYLRVGNSHYLKLQGTLKYKVPGQLWIMVVTRRSYFEPIRSRCHQNEWPLRPKTKRTSFTAHKVIIQVQKKNCWSSSMRWTFECCDLLLMTGQTFFSEFGWIWIQLKGTYGVHIFVETFGTPNIPFPVSGLSRPDSETANRLRKRL